MKQEYESYVADMCENYDALMEETFGVINPYCLD